MGACKAKTRESLRAQARSPTITCHWMYDADPPPYAGDEGARKYLSARTGRCIVPGCRHASTWVECFCQITDGYITGGTGTGTGTVQLYLCTVMFK